MQLLQSNSFFEFQKISTFVHSSIIPISFSLFVIILLMNYEYFSNSSTKPFLYIESLVPTFVGR